MRIPTTAVISILTASLASGCAARQAAVPMVGAESDVSALAGQWVGEYSSTETGRSGSISFTLSARGDTARGDVVMIPNGRNQALQPWRDETVRSMDRSLPEVLAISFVRVSGNEVSGALDPYRDPECGCPLYTRFTGRLSGDVIEGTFITRHGQLAQEQRGRWSATRTGR